jgi:uncharacterized protein YggU (UPF0235/DUF167 family)
VLKVRLMASPAGTAAANKELIDFLAARLGISTNHIEIVAGEAGREKIVSVEGLSVDQVEAMIVGE